MSALKPPDNWQPPSAFDLVKEMNAQAGRLATFLGLLLASTTFSVGNGPVHEALYQTHDVSYLLLIIMLCLLAWDLSIGFLSVLLAMDPAVESIQASRQSWESLLEVKHRYCQRAFNASIASAMALGGAWAASLFRGPTLIYGLGYVFVFICAVAALPYFWGIPRFAEATYRLRPLVRHARTGFATWLLHDAWPPFVLWVKHWARFARRAARVARYLTRLHLIQRGRFRC